MANIKVDEEAEARLILLYQSGLTATEIAKQERLHLDTVTRCLKRAGLHIQRGPRVRVTKQQVEIMLSEYTAGRSTTEIAASLGDVNASTVQRYLRNAGVGIRPAGFRTGSAHHGWKGGRIVSEDGYVLVLVYPDDPFYAMAQVKSSSAGKYVLEHRLVMARHLGRLLTEDETVHHVDDHDRQNNDITNLQLRIGRHGKHAAFRCADCGSHNVVATPLASPTEG